MAGVWIVHRIIDDFCGHGVEMNVRNQLVQIPWIVDHFRFVSALPPRTARLPPDVVILAKPRLDITHRPSQRHWPSPHRDVIVVGHQAPREHREPVSTLHLLQQVKELLGLFPFAEDLRSTFEPVADVVGPTQNEDPRSQSKVESVSLFATGYQN